MIFKQVPGYPLYEVSDQGVVRHIFNGELRPNKEKTGYLIVWLYAGTKRKKFTVHRLMALTFLGAGSETHVHHKDRNKHNNTLSNLELLSRSEHMAKHYVEIAPNNLGERNGMAKFSNKEARAIKEAYRDSGLSLVEFCKTLNLNHAAVHYIVYRRKGI